MIHIGVDFVRNMVVLLLMPWSFVSKTFGKIVKW